MKAAIFHPAAIAIMRCFPDDVRREMGKPILDLQKGETLSTRCLGRCLPLRRACTSLEFATVPAFTGRSTT
jgi:hypothetical protein